jgi:2-dehydro-3-deoxyphosphogluconate aldolase / (4S)-4-hydroxy-2-oxoglutarate aldolase
LNTNPQWDDGRVFERVSELGVVPVIAIEEARWALPLADALLAGGLPLVEITFRTAAAPEVIHTLARERPQLLVGAGTLLDRESVDLAHSAGARFAVAPGLNAAVVNRARELRLPFAPGVATPSEVEQALALGCRTLKFFPAELLGGTRMLDTLMGPYGHTGVRFLPTGGVNLANLAAYLACRGVAAVGGTWLARKEDLAAGAWEVICQRCREAVKQVRDSRANCKAPQSGAQKPP